jgi:hypothetical protein
METSVTQDTEGSPIRREDTIGYKVVQSFLLVVMYWAFLSYRHHWRLLGHQWIEIAAFSVGVSIPKQNRWRWVCLGIWIGCIFGDLADHTLAMAGIGIGGK